MSTPVSSRPRRVRPTQLGSLEECLYEGTGLAAHGISPELRLHWFAAAAAHHTTTNLIYQRLAARDGFTPEALLDDGDLSRIPLLPAAIYKRSGQRLASGTTGDVQHTRSSGTSGSTSVIPRDQPTLERFVGTVGFGVRDFLGTPVAREVFVLGPRTDEAGDIWFSYVLSLVGLLHETSFAVHDGEFLRERLWTSLSELEDGAQPTIVGPPSLLLDFLDWCEERRYSIDLGSDRRNAFVVTAGGWKKRADEAVSREDLAGLVERVLGVPATRVRDAYNAVELNTVLFECDHGRKHVPPWLEIQARRSSDLSRCADGEVGLLSFLDATATSYPAFYLSDDFGATTGDLDSRCACGRHGPALLIERRVVSGDQRGCGLSLNRYAAEEGETSVGRS